MWGFEGEIYEFFCWSKDLLWIGCKGGLTYFAFCVELGVFGGLFLGFGRWDFFWWIMALEPTFEGWSWNRSNDSIIRWVRGLDCGWVGTGKGLWVWSRVGCSPPFGKGFDSVGEPAKLGGGRVSVGCAPTTGILLGVCGWYPSVVAFKGLVQSQYFSSDVRWRYLFSSL